MVAFFIAAVFGAFQVFMLKFALKNLTGGNKKKALVFLLIKFFAYALAVGLLMTKFTGSLTDCALGFVAGMPFFAIILFAVTAWRNKDR